MRLSYLLVPCLIVVAGCANRPAIVKPGPESLPPGQASVPHKPVTADHAAYIAIDAVVTLEETRFERNELRCSDIESTSQGQVELTVSRSTTLRDSTGLMAESILSLEEGHIVDGLAYWGRYWGVRTNAGTCGYVMESALDGGYRDIVTVRQGTSALLSQSSFSSVSGGASGSSGSRPRSVTCEDFSSISAAQIAYDADPGRLSHLDGDNDGRACEAGTGGGR